MRSCHINPVIYYHWSLLILKICIFNCIIGKAGLSQAQMGAGDATQCLGLPRCPACQGLKLGSLRNTEMASFPVLITMSWGHPSSLYQRSDLKSKMGQQFWQVNKRPWSCRTPLCRADPGTDAAPLGLNSRGHEEPRGLSALTLLQAHRLKVCASDKHFPTTVPWRGNCGYIKHSSAFSNSLNLFTSQGPY